MTADTDESTLLLSIGQLAPACRAHDHMQATRRADLLIPMLARFLD